MISYTLINDRNGVLIATVCHRGLRKRVVLTRVRNTRKLHVS